MSIKNSRIGNYLNATNTYFIGTKEKIQEYLRQNPESGHRNLLIIYLEETGLALLSGLAVATNLSIDALSSLVQLTNDIPYHTEYYVFSLLLLI